MNEQRMRFFMMNEIVERGLDDVVDEAVAYSIEGGAKGVFISVDVDVVDPGLAPGTGTPEPGGLNSREMLDTVRRLDRSQRPGRFFAHSGFGIVEGFGQARNGSSVLDFAQGPCGLLANHRAVVL